MLPSISFENGVYQKEGKSLFLTSGEFHYFRVPKSDWRARLSLLKEAGILCAATYIPWLLHEPEEGVFDFESEMCIIDRPLPAARPSNIPVQPY